MKGASGLGCHSTQGCLQRWHQQGWVEGTVIIPSHMTTSSSLAGAQLRKKWMEKTGVMGDIQLQAIEQTLIVTDALSL